MRQDLRQNGTANQHFRTVAMVTITMDVHVIHCLNEVQKERKKEINKQDVRGKEGMSPNTPIELIFFHRYILISYGETRKLLAYV